MATKIQLRRDLAASWTSTNPVLGQGEPGLETDTNQIKYGNGYSAWRDLPYAKALGAGANIDVTRARAGQITVLGDFPNNYTDFWFDSIVADDAGNSYGIGSNQDYNEPTVVKMNAAGVVQWQTRLEKSTHNDGGAASAGHIDPTNGELVVVSTHYWDTATSIISRLNPTTGAYVTESAIELADVGNLYAKDIALTSSGSPVVVGGSYGEYNTFPVTPLSASNGSGQIQIAKADIAGAGASYPNTYNNWYITGSDIVGEDVLVSVNTWYGVNSTSTISAPTLTPISDVIAITDVASIATFATSIDGGATGAAHGLVSGDLIQATNTGYGVTSSTQYYALVSDLYEFTVESTLGGGALPTSSFTPFSDPGTPLTFSKVTPGVTGSGATFDVFINMATGAYEVNDYSSSGANYTVGATITILGTALGGTSPANDLTFIVEGVDGGNSNSIDAWGTVTGIGNTTNILLQVDQIIDFTDTTNGRSWSIKQYLNEEAFIWTPEWKLSLGGGDYDSFNAVGIDSQGNVYAGGYSDSNNSSLLMKFNSDGDIQWTKKIDPAGDYYGITGLAIDSEDNIVLAATTEGPLLITKMNGDGAIMWQTRYGNNGPIGLWNGSVAIDLRNNDILVGAEFNSITSRNNDFFILKLTTTGSVLWQRSLGTPEDENTWYNDGHQLISLSGDYYYVAGNTRGYGSQDNAVAARLPLDGSGLGTSIGRVWNYINEAPNEWNIDTLATQSANIIGLTSRTELLSDSSTVLNYYTENYDTQVQPLYTGAGGSIEKIKSLVFEDGTEMNSAASTLVEQPRGPQDDTSIWLDLRDIGTQIWFKDVNGGYDSYVYVPASYQANFPIGSAITLIVDDIDGSSVYVNTDGNNDVKIIANNWPATYNNYNNWRLQGDGNVGVYTLLKIDTDRWVLSGPNVQDDY